MQFITPTKDECDFLLIIFKTRKNKIMTIEQIILISVLTFLAIIGFIGSSILDKYEKRVEFTFLSFFCYGSLLVVSFVALAEMNTYKELYKKGCPQYEKVENVYKLKEVQNGHH